MERISLQENQYTMLAKTGLLNPSQIRHGPIQNSCYSSDLLGMPVYGPTETSAYDIIVFPTEVEAFVWACRGVN